MTKYRENDVILTQGMYKVVHKGTEYHVINTDTEIAEYKSIIIVDCFRYALAMNDLVKEYLEPKDWGKPKEQLKILGVN